VPRRGRPPSGDGGATVAVAGGKVAGCTGGAAAAGGAAPACPPGMVGRVSVIDWHEIGSTNLHPPNSTETYTQNHW